MPNPASAVATLKHDLKGTADHAFARIVDAVGREIARISITSSPGQSLLDTRKLPSGVYSVELYNRSARVATERVIVQTQ